MKISFVVLSYQRRDAVLALLEGLSRVEDPDTECIVVVNGSTDGTADAVAGAYPGVRLIRLPENVGVGARNRGLEAAIGEIAVCLDDDMLGTEHMDLARLRACFRDDPRLGGLNFKVTWPGTNRIRDWVHRRSLDFADDTFPTYEITEGAVAWRLAALSQVGYYREDFFISHEGLDLAYRLLNHDWVIAYDGRIRISHNHVSSDRPGWRRYYFDTRNLLWVSVLHQPASYAIRYIGLGLTAMLVYSLRDGHFLAWLRAVRDGLQRFPELRKQRRVWTRNTRHFIREADSWRPGFWTLVGKRIRDRKFSME